MIRRFVTRLVQTSAVMVVAAFSLMAVAQPVYAQVQDTTNNDTVIVPATDTDSSTGAIVTPSPTPTATGTIDPSLAETLNNICAGANFEFGTSCNNSAANREAEESFSRLIKTVVNIFSTVVGVAAVIMIIIGGLRYITSGGDSSSVSSAKNTILYVVVGLVVVAMSQFVVRFVVSRLQTVS